MPDAGGVEFYLELNAKMDEAVQMVQQMNKLQAEALKLDMAMKKAGKTTSITADVFGKATNAFKSAGSAMISHLGALATFEGIKRVGGWLMDVGGEALQAAGEAERTRRSFELMMGDVPAGNLLGFLDRVAQHTEFTDGALKNFGARLVKTGLQGEGLERAMGAVLDLAALNPDKMAGAGEALSLVSRIKLKGGVSERELVSAGLSPQKFFEQVSAETGIGIKQVEKAIGAGKVKTDALLEALYSTVVEKTGKPLWGATQAQSKTFLAQMEKTRDIIPNLFEELEATGGLQPVTNALSKLVQGLSPDSPAGGKIVAGLTLMLDRFGKLVSSIDFDAWAGRLSTAMDIFGTVVEVGAAVGGELGMLFDKFTLFGEALGESLFETTQMVGDFFNAAGKLGTALWEGMQDGIVKGITWVVDSAKKLGDAAIGSLKSVLGISSPSKIFAEAGMDTGAGFGIGIMKAMPGVADTVARAFSPEALLPTIEARPLPAVAAGIAGGMAVGSAMASSARGEGPRLEAHVTVNVGAAPGDETRARELGAELEVSIRRALAAVLSQMAAEGAAT